SRTSVFFSMLPPPPISTLFPYTTLFRSVVPAHPERSSPRCARQKARVPSRLATSRTSTPHDGSKLHRSSPAEFPTAPRSPALQCTHDRPNRRAPQLVQLARFRHPRDEFPAAQWSDWPRR